MQKLHVMELQTCPYQVGHMLFLNQCKELIMNSHTLTLLDAVLLHC